MGWPIQEDICRFSDSPVRTNWKYVVYTGVILPTNVELDYYYSGRTCWVLSNYLVVRKLDEELLVLLCKTFLYMYIS